MEEYTENVGKDKSCRLFEESFVEKVNNIKITDYDDWVKMCEKLTNRFSLIPLNRTEKERSKCKKPVDKDWSRACLTRQGFERSKFVVYNPGIACGKASNVIVLNILNGHLFKDFLQKNSFELVDATFVVESGDGTVQYYFEYPDDGCEYTTVRIGRELTDEFGNFNEKMIFEIVGCDGYVLAPGALDPITWKYGKIISNTVPAKAPVWILKILETKKSKIIIKHSVPEIKKDDSENQKKCTVDNRAEVLGAEELTISSERSSPQERFKKHFDKLIGWGVDKSITTWTSLTVALEKSNYLAFPQSRRQYLCLDLDWEGSGAIWMDEGFPEPTITFINRENGHSNLAYELETPVIWPCEYNSYNVRPRPIRYFKAIRDGFNTKTGADCGYTNSTIKNPYSSRWRVTWADKRYDLAYLAEFVTLRSFYDPYAKFKSGIYAGRNDELYHLGLRWSYRNVKRYFKPDEFYNDILEFIKSENFTTIITHWPERSYLPSPEVTGIAKGIFKHTWPRRNSTHFKHLIKNFGVLGFAPIDRDMKLRDRKMEVYERQYRGSKHTHGIVSQDSIRKIDEAIECLIRAGKKVSYNKISKTSCLDYKTILKYKEYVSSKIEFLEKVF
jgi:hypothetical protein